MYTQGVLDALMEEGIHFQTVTGISAGAMSALGYLSGQIGLSARINLGHRHDRQYCGAGAMLRDHGVTGFSYFFETFLPAYGFDKKRFQDPRRDFITAATNIRTGKAEYFHKGTCDIFRVVRASATVPYLSKPVRIDNEEYLDGGCAVKIPLDYALDHGFEKIVVVRTRDRNYRAEEKKISLPARMIYHSCPALLHSLADSAKRYNNMLDKIDSLEQEGRLFVIAPSEPVTISRFEGALEKLGELYWQGLLGAHQRIGELRRYLQLPENPPVLCGISSR
ncbi:MAG: patatin family protein [Eubacterium sp.]|nr:patatin family protein [Eubacterium sp.]